MSASLKFSAGSDEWLNLYSKYPVSKANIANFDWFTEWNHMHLHIVLSVLILRGDIVLVTSMNGSWGSYLYTTTIILCLNNMV